MPGIVTALVGAALVAAPVLPQHGGKLRQVASQSRETSCSVAALANLLKWAGYRTSEAHLDDIMRTNVLNNDPTAISQYLEKGASAREMAQLVTALNASFELKAELVSIEAARSLAGREAYIAFLIDGGSGGLARSHFTIVAGYDPRRGWLRADSIDGGHVWQKHGDFSRAALVHREQSRVLILRLIRNGRVAVPAEDARSLSQSHVPWIASSRLLSGAARTRSPIASLSISHSGQLFEANGVAIRDRGMAVVASLSHPLSKNDVAIVSLPYRAGNTALGIEGVGDFDLGRSSGVGPVGLQLVHHLKNRGTTVRWISGSLDIETSGQPVRLGMSTGVERPVGASAIMSMSAGIDVQRSGDHWELSLTPAITIVRMLGKRSSVTVNASATKSFEATEPTVALGFGLNRQISNTVAVGVSADWVVSSPISFRSRTFGINIIKRLSTR